MNHTRVITATSDGLWFEAGGFHVDPWRPVDRAVVTHAHSDHARPGCGHYLAAAPGTDIMRIRLDGDASIETLPYGETTEINGVRVSFHPAGHLLGSAQEPGPLRTAVKAFAGLAPVLLGLTTEAATTERAVPAASVEAVESKPLTIGGEASDAYSFEIT